MISILVIGNEILSHQIQDINLKTMLRDLSAAGYAIDEVRIVRDDISQISGAIQALSARSRFLISSGGVGPTHDDVTFAAYAQAFGVTLVRNDELEGLIRKFYGTHLKERSLQMAMVPTNTELIGGEDVPWPLIKIRNCFVLPGLPEVFLKKFKLLLTLLPPVAPTYFAEVCSRVDEAHFAEALGRFQERFPQVEIGSYPRWDQSKFAAQVTMKGKQLDMIHACFEVVKAYFEADGRIAGFKAPHVFQPVSDGPGEWPGE